MSIYKDSMDKITPHRSPEELAAEIAGAEKAEKAHRVRPLAAAAAGLAAAAALTVTAGAAGGWNFPEMIRSWFGGQNEESYSEKLIEVGNVDCMKNSFDGLEFEVKGAVADDIFVTVFLDVTRTDGGIFDCNEYDIGVPPEYGEGHTEKPHITLSGEASAAPGGADSADSFISYFDKHIEFTSHVMDDGDPNDNRVTFALIMDTDQLKIARAGGDTADIDLHIFGLHCYKSSFADANRNGGVVNIVLDDVVTDEFNGIADIHVELPLAAGKAKKLSPNIEVEMLIFPHTNNVEELIYTPYPFTLTGLEVSSAAVKFEIEGEPTDGRYYPLMLGDLVKVNLKDGSSFTLDAEMPHNGMSTGGSENSAYDSWRISYAIAFGRIIDVDDIVSVELGGQTVEL